jgi:hypothetical protein
MGSGTLSRVTLASSLKPDSISIPIDDMTDLIWGGQPIFISPRLRLKRIIRLIYFVMQSKSMKIPRSDKKMSNSLKIMTFFSFAVLSGCNLTEKYIFDSSGIGIEERIAVMNKILVPLAEVPSKILDVHYIETRIGDGQVDPFARLGPSDFLFYALIKVPKEEAKKWSQGLKEPYNGVTDFSSPAGDKKWWLTEEKFKNFKLYETNTYFGRVNGWMAVDDVSGCIYVHTYTL